jgi:hypothetical protein
MIDARGLDAHVFREITEIQPAVAWRAPGFSPESLSSLHCLTANFSVMQQIFVDQVDIILQTKTNQVVG